MALIICSNCGKTFSFMAKSCPGCGKLTKKCMIYKKTDFEIVPGQKPHIFNNKLLISLLSLTFFVLIILVFSYSNYFFNK